MKSDPHLRMRVASGGNRWNTLTQSVRIVPPAVCVSVSERWRLLHAKLVTNDLNNDAL